MKKVFLFFAMLLCTFLFTGCQPKQVELSNMVVGQENLKKLVENPDVIKSAQYESAYKAYMVLGRPCSFGPTDPAYRGIIKLNEEDGKKLFEEHEWDEYTGTLPTFTNIDTTPLNSDTWYTVALYDWDFFHSYYPPDEFYFNGKDTIVFSVQTY